MTVPLTVPLIMKGHLSITLSSVRSSRASFCLRFSDISVSLAPFSQTIITELSFISRTPITLFVTLSGTGAVYYWENRKNQLNIVMYQVSGKQSKLAALLVWLSDVQPFIFLDVWRTFTIRTSQDQIGPLWLNFLFQVSKYLVSFQPTSDFENSKGGCMN